LLALRFFCFVSFFQVKLSFFRLNFLKLLDASTDPSILAVRGGYNATYPLTQPVYTGHEVLFKIGIISDPDKASRSDDSVRLSLIFFKIQFLV